MGGFTQLLPSRSLRSSRAEEGAGQRWGPLLVQQQEPESPGRCFPDGDKSNQDGEKPLQEGGQGLPGPSALPQLLPSRECSGESRRSPAGQTELSLRPGLGLIQGQGICRPLLFEETVKRHKG